MADTAPRSPSLTTAALIGVFAGAVSGLFGVGGGILIVPALAIVGAMGQRRAHGTSLAATAPLALAGLVGFALEGEADWTVAVLLLSGSAVGAVVGTHFLQRLPQRTLRYGFAALLLLTAARMMFDIPEGSGSAVVTVASAVALVVVGFVSGSIAGLMGVGGGIIMVPAQMLLFGIPAALAKGTSLAVIVPTAIVGTVQNLRGRNTDIPVAAAVGGAGTVTAFAASRVAIGLDPTVSAILFAALLLVAALRLLKRREKEPAPAPDAV